MAENDMYGGLTSEQYERLLNLGELPTTIPTIPTTSTSLQNIPQTTTPITPTFDPISGVNQSINDNIDLQIVRKLREDPSAFKETMMSLDPNAGKTLFGDQQATPEIPLPSTITPFTTKTDKEIIDTALTSGITKDDYSNLLATPLGTSDDYFKDYLKAINESDLGEAALNQSLLEIDRATQKNLADISMAMQERGLGGVGQISDIEANALAQARMMGEEQKGKTKADILKRRGEAIIGAYGKRYDTFQTEADRILRGNTAYAQLSSQEKTSLLDNVYKKAISDAELLLKRELTLTELAQVKDLALREMNNKIEIARISGHKDTNTLDDISKGIDITSDLLGIGVGIASLAAFSDINLKKDIKKIKTIKNINIYEYFYKTDEYEKLNLPKEKQIGIIAQEIEHIIPESVFEVNGYKAVDYKKVFDYIVR